MARAERSQGVSRVGLDGIRRYVTRWSRTPPVFLFERSSFRVEKPYPVVSSAALRKTGLALRSRKAPPRSAPSPAPPCSVPCRLFGGHEPVPGELTARARSRARGRERRRLRCAPSWADDGGREGAHRLRGERRWPHRYADAEPSARSPTTSHGVRERPQRKQAAASARRSAKRAPRSRRRFGRVVVRHIHRDDVDVALTAAFAGLLWAVIAETATESEQALLAGFEPPPATDQEVVLTEIALRERGTL